MVRSASARVSSRAAGSWRRGTSRHAATAGGEGGDDGLCPAADAVALAGEGEGGGRRGGEADHRPGADETGAGDGGGTGWRPNVFAGRSWIADCGSVLSG